MASVDVIRNYVIKLDQTEANCLKTVLEDYIAAFDTKPNRHYYIELAEKIRKHLANALA